MIGANVQTCGVAARIGENEAGNAVSERGLADAFEATDQPGVRQPALGKSGDDGRFRFGVAEELAAFARVRSAGEAIAFLGVLLCHPTTVRVGSGTGGGAAAGAVCAAGAAAAGAARLRRRRSGYLNQMRTPEKSGVVVAAITIE